eukprot:gene486-biopygen6455
MSAALYSVAIDGRPEDTFGVPSAGGGDVVCGDLGCPLLARYSFVGEAAGWVMHAERLATGWQSGAVVNGVAKAGLGLGSPTASRWCSPGGPAALPSCFHGIPVTGTNDDSLWAFL